MSPDDIRPGYHEARATLQRISDAIDPDGGPLRPEHYDALAEAVEGLVSDAHRGRQPAPTPGVGDVWAELIDAETDDDLRALMVERRALGIARYGRPLQRCNGRNTHRDLREELLDAMAYAQAENDAQLATVLRDCVAHIMPGRQGPAPIDARTYAADRHRWISTMLDLRAAESDVDHLRAKCARLDGDLGRYRMHLDDIRCDVADAGIIPGRDVPDDDQELTPRRQVGELLARFTRARERIAGLEAQLVELERRLEHPAWLAVIVGAVALVWAALACMLPGVL